ncbi:MAG: 50S ribosomal protein L29 [Candidatus Coatesbacteria bacterium]|nr:MAG: 50S ribosomal protein L29 [Candidatus Coatesbacteria bacterium]
MTRKSQLWALGAEELKGMEADLRRELFNLRFQKATGQIQNPLRLRTARRELSRVITIREQKEATERDSDGR